MVNLAYFKIGRKVWKAKYTNGLINYFSCSFNLKFTGKDYY
jgi:hypothetical protein